MQTQLQSVELDASWSYFFHEYGWRLLHDPVQQDRVISYVQDWMEGIPPPQPEDAR